MGVLDRFEGIPSSVQGAAGGALKDLRSIAESVKGLPEVGRHLAEIRSHTASLDEEVRKMRAEVSQIKEEVEVLTSSLGTKLDDLSGALHPLRRTRSKFGRGARDDSPDSD